MPVEEPVLVGESFDLGHGGGEGEGVGVLGDRGEHVVGGWAGGSGLQGPDEGGAPGVGVQSGAAHLLGLLVRSPGGGAGAGSGDVVGGGEDPGAVPQESGGVDAALGSEEGGLPGAFGLVLLADGGGVLLVVAGDLLERVVGHPLSQEGGGGAEQGVADPDAGVEESEGLARFEGLQPEGDLRQLGGEVVEVDAVDAPADDVVQGVGDLFGGGFVLAGAGLGDAAGDPPGCRDEETAGARGWVADGDSEQAGFGVGGILRVLDCVVEDGVQGGVEQRRDERGWGVVGAGGLALVAGQVLQARTSARRGRGGGRVRAGIRRRCRAPRLRGCGSPQVGSRAPLIDTQARARMAVSRSLLANSAPRNRSRFGAEGSAVARGSGS